MGMASRIYLDYCAEMAAKIEDGQAESMGFYFELSEMAKEIDKVKEQIFPSVISEVSRFDPRELSSMGISYQADGRGKHEYSHLAEWMRLKAQLTAFEEHAKKNNLTIIKQSKPILTKKTKNE